MKTGWWQITFEGFELEELSDATLLHIGEQIRDGNREGQIVEHDQEAELREALRDGRA